MEYNNDINVELNKMYKNYLENALNIKYKKVFIKKETPLYNSRVCLCTNDGNILTEYHDSIEELDKGKFYLARNRTNNNKIVNVFYDNNGKEIKRIKDLYIGDFHDGIARVKTVGRNPRCGYISTNGELIGEIKWGERSSDFNCGRAKVESMEKNSLGRFGFINKEGKIVIPCNSTNYYEFSDDVVCQNESGLKNFYDKNGNKLFSDVLINSYFSNGLIIFENKKSKKGYKNKQGEVVIKPKFKNAGNFSNGIAQVDDGYIDLTGKKVKVSRIFDGVLYIEGFLNFIYYNNVTGKYDKMNFVPYKDYGDYLLVNSNKTIGIYSKKTGILTNTGISFDLRNMYINFCNDFLVINNQVFYLRPDGCIDLKDIIDVVDIYSFEDFPDLLSYDDFKLRIEQDKSFAQQFMQEVSDVRNAEIIKNIEEQRKSQDSKRQEIIDQLQKLKQALGALDDTSGVLSKIDENILLHDVDDHREINEEFLDQLRFLDLSYINFKNVKVSGLDLSGSNACINPQEVYQKDMSNGNYSGLYFVSRDFTGVNIKGATFEECNMDFAILDRAIQDETTQFGTTIKF